MKLELAKNNQMKKKNWQIRVKTLKKWVKNQFFVFKILKYIRFGKRYFERVQYAHQHLTCADQWQAESLLIVKDCTTDSP